MVYIVVYITFTVGARFLYIFWAMCLYIQSLSHEYKFFWGNFAALEFYDGWEVLRKLVTSARFWIIWQRVLRRIMKIICRPAKFWRMKKKKKIYIKITKTKNKGNKNSMLTMWRSLEFISETCSTRNFRDVLNEILFLYLEFEKNINSKTRSMRGNSEAC